MAATNRAAGVAGAEVAVGDADVDAGGAGGGDHAAGSAGRAPQPATSRAAANARNL
ncbi:hypothetical protein Asi02nite_76180 [Asanoa siamensis]|uniref:Uncharacterized protein n=1 Tax=Asanoa siamensis TaxID=926357 RepID=A0ABQ4D3M9_9ACTN|nr:hypothetical protein Asi02nite_76180 [Asanoa siamensis]